MRKTKIICTIGPASESEEMIEKLINAGMNVARLNFSHGSYEEHKTRIDRLKKVREKLGRYVAIMLDTKGPEVRLGRFEGGKAQLQNGQKFTLTIDETVGNDNGCSISYMELPKAVSGGTRILIADGLIELAVVDWDDRNVVCEVVNGGEVGDRKNVNIPGATSKLPAVTEKDVEDLKFGIENGIDLIAASFIRKAADILEIRRVLEENGGNSIQVIAKIENQEGVDNCDEILMLSDGLMVARGDLGVEIHAEEIPLIQKMLIDKANKAGKPVITATQMLDSMIRNPRPTRAEVTDIANSIIDGTDAIMLSGETAAGKYPVEAVAMMATIAQRTEAALDYKKFLTKSYDASGNIVANAISHASCTTAADLEAAAIVTPTHSGSTARMVSKFRPKAPIIAVTTNDSVCRQLSLSFGVYPLLVDAMDNTDILIENSVNTAVENGYVKSGDLIVITAGIPSGVAGTTNLIKVHIVSEVLASGIGIGDKSITGKVCVIEDAEQDAEKLQQGDILVTAATDKDMVPLMEKASAFIVVEGGITSHAAVVGLVLGKPVIVGVYDAVDVLKDGMVVTIDTARGLIYSGISRV